MGLFEILLIAVVTLLVVGPERMPEAVRSAALTIGRVKRMLSGAREEIEKQVGADEIRRQLNNEAIMEKIAKVKQDLSSFDQSLEQPPEKAQIDDDDYDHEYHDEHDADRYDHSDNYDEDNPVLGEHVDTHPPISKS